LNIANEHIGNGEQDKRLDSRENGFSVIKERDASVLPHEVKSEEACSINQKGQEFLVLERIVFHNLLSFLDLASLVSAIGARRIVCLQWYCLIIEFKCSLCITFKTASYSADDNLI